MPTEFIIAALLVLGLILAMWLAFGGVDRERWQVTRSPTLEEQLRGMLARVVGAYDAVSVAGTGEAWTASRVQLRNAITDARELLEELAEQDAIRAELDASEAGLGGVL